MSAELFNRYQSRAMQFALDVFAALESKGVVTERELSDRAERLGLDNIALAQVIDPLVRAGLLARDSREYRRGEDSDYRPTLPLGNIEREYLAYILTLPEAELFLDEGTRAALSGGGERLFDSIELYAPKGEELPKSPGAEGFRLLLKAIREGKLIRYRYRTRMQKEYVESVVQPWKVEYSAYDRRWWVILYDSETDRTIKARMDNLRDISIAGDAAASPEYIGEVVERQLEAEPVVLHVTDERNALERCFLFFENALFEQTEQTEDGCLLKFRCYRFDRSDILRKLLALGPFVTILEPESLRRAYAELVDAALAQFL